MNSARSDYGEKTEQLSDKIMVKNNYMVHVRRVKEQTFLKDRGRDRLKMDGSCYMK